jgi:hypothetical protein
MLAMLTGACECRASSDRHSWFVVQHVLSYVLA